MFFSNYAEPSKDRKRCHYKCDCGQTEFTITLDVGDRKLSRWCRVCKKKIYPIAITHMKTTRRSVH